MDLPCFLACLVGGVHGGTRGYTQKASLSSRIHADTRGYTVPARKAKFAPQSEKSHPGPNFQKRCKIPLISRRVDQYCQDPAAILEACRIF